jgi:hypothetical protein
MQDELLVAGAQEFALYNAQRSLRPGRNAARAIHAPARRIARTLVCLGRQVGQRRGVGVKRVWGDSRGCYVVRSLVCLGRQVGPGAWRGPRGG